MLESGGAARKAAAEVNGALHRLRYNPPAEWCQVAPTFMEPDVANQLEFWTVDAGFYSGQRATVLAPGWQRWRGSAGPG